MGQDAKGRRIQFWLGIIISLIAVAAILLFIKPGDIWGVIREADIGHLLFAFVGLFLFLIIRAVRWRFMLIGGTGGDSELGFINVFHVQNVGYLVTNILPFRLGDVARAVMIGNVPPVSVGQGLSTVLVERVLDMLFMVVLFPFTIVSAVDLPPEWQSAVIIAGVLSLVAALIFVLAANFPQLSLRLVAAVCDRVRFLDSENWVNRARNILQGLDTLTRWRDAAILLILSILVWLPLIAGYYFGIRSMHLDVSLFQAAFVVCIAAFSLAAPSSPGGLGVQEAAIAFALNGALGFPNDEAVGFALTYRALYYLLTGAMGILGINRLGETFGSVIASTRSLVSSRNQQEEEQSDEEVSK